VCGAYDLCGQFGEHGCRKANAQEAAARTGYDEVFEGEVLETLKLCNEWKDVICSRDLEPENGMENKEHGQYSASVLWKILIAEMAVCSSIISTLRSEVELTFSTTHLPPVD